MNSLTTLQHLNNYLNAPAFQNETQKSIRELERQNTTQLPCQTLQLTDSADLGLLRAEEARRAVKFEQKYFSYEIAI